jgi:hypothetical protein
VPGGDTMFGVTRSNHLFLGVLCLIIFLSSHIFASSWFDLAFSEHLSLGKAAIAANNNVAAAFLNPSRLSSLNQNYLGSSSSSKFGQDISLYNIYATHHIKNLDIGIHIPIKQISNIPETEADDDDEGIKIGELSDTQIGLQLSVSTALSHHNSLGFSIKGETQTLASETAQALRLDLGFSHIYESLSLGLSIENLLSQKTWSTGREETMPILYHISTDYSLNESISLLSDIELSDETSQLHLGAMTQISQSLSIHTGVADIFNTKEWGLGLDLDLSGFHIKYAMSSAHVLGASHTLGVSLAY